MRLSPEVAILPGAGSRSPYASEIANHLTVL
jgi:hypothetical protein